MSEELKPCPLCGCTDIKMDFGPLHCRDCRKEYVNAATVDVLRERWNTRPLEDVQAAEIEQLQKRVKELEGILSGDPSQTATPEDREAWRHSAVRYSRVLEVENATLRAENARLADEAERLRNGVGKNKLFVWKDVLTDYTSGVMFAIAPDIETARKTVIEEEKKTNGGYASQYMSNELSKEPEIIDVGVAYAYSVWGGG